VLCLHSAEQLQAADHEAWTSQPPSGDTLNAAGYATTSRLASTRSPSDQREGPAGRNRFNATAQLRPQHLQIFQPGRQPLDKGGCLAAPAQLPDPCPAEARAIGENPLVPLALMPR